MHEELKEKIKAQKPRMAICYDFDKTLSPDDMQTFTLIPSLGMDANTFWDETKELAQTNLMDNNLAWMYQLIIRSKTSRQKISKEYFCEIGKNIPLYRGVKTWFTRINKYAENHGIILEHYIISSGLKEIIQGSEIAPFIKRIYASSYLYSADGVAEWPSQAVNYTTKTQFIFRIAKGKFEEYDESVNETMEANDLYIPYENIVYIGDSATDIPCMRLVKSKGGYSIGVFDPKKDDRKKVYQLFNDERISLYAPADYSATSALTGYIQNIIKEIQQREAIKTEQKLLEISADFYELYKNVEKIANNINTKKNRKSKNALNEALAKIKEMIEGKIDE